MMSMTKTSNRAIFALIAVLAALALGMGLATVAEPGAAYADAGKYKVRVFGGNEGKVDSSMAEQTVAYGDTVTLDKSKVKVTNDKYYVEGFRLSGKDALHVESFTVTEDMDFVVDYGVKGDMVSYTLNFVDYNNTSKKLASSVTYYGKKGDKPVAAYKHIKGYRPRFANITATLGDEGTNEWTFKYIKDSGTSSSTTTTTSSGTTSSTTTSSSTVTSTSTGGTTSGTTNSSTVGATGTTDSSASSSEGAAAADGAGGAATDGDGTSTDEAAPPTEELDDLDTETEGDSNEVTGSGTLANTTEVAAQNEPPYGMIFGIALVIVAIIGGVTYYLRTRRE